MNTQVKIIVFVACIKMLGIRKVQKSLAMLIYLALTKSFIGFKGFNR